MDNKKFKKQFKLLVPASDKGNSLIMEPGTKGYVILSDTTGKMKIAVKIDDLKDAADEVEILHSLYLKENETTNTEKEIPIDGFDISDVGYED